MLPHDEMGSDEGIRATNDDASSCKRYAAEKGYWTDKYIPLFVPTAHRKPPEISRGYYARVTAIKCLLENFLRLTDCKCQVINLGAGFDTTFWKLKEEGLTPQSFIEVDFPHVTVKKCHFIKSKKDLIEAIQTEDGEIMVNKTDLHGSTYHLVSADLRNLSELQKKLKECDINTHIPTMFIAECVLVYIDSSRTSRLLKWLNDSFKTSLFLLYEQVNMTDHFARIMVENLKSRECLLHGIDSCISLETQKERFLTHGWESAEALDMLNVYQNIPKEDKQRIEKLEMMDEKELLDQLLQHYCICWASNDSAKIGLEDIRLPCLEPKSI